ncbi:MULTISPECIES: regulatory protein RecX [Gemella]|uniref:RecX family transcriptional regulator n=1 Tax=Gemella TaxID=1378 RepID=UPI0007680747|nr:MULTISPECIES: RecX family transcriptional regulator [Gemella]AME09277.1 RecX family transcriptional regulator [Gemella sp. oral taxon 928]AXI26911.1 RecX family transcriptional regulator [Gemella sp. ND 6198]
MKIENITKLKIKYKIELDNGKHFYVSEETVIKYGLIKKIELSGEQLKEILSHENIEKAYTKAINYLNYGLRTERDMREYLEKKEIVSDIIDEVIERLKVMGYINDIYYIEAAVTDYFNLNKKGPYWIKRKLLGKGLNKEVVEENIQKICTEERMIDTLYRIIEREFNAKRESKNKKIQKITHKLYTNGYSFDIIRKVFDIFFEDYEDVDENDVLETYFNRAYRNYLNRYEGYMLKQKIIEKLVRDGFSYYDVKNFLETKDL